METMKKNTSMLQAYTKPATTAIRIYAEGGIMLGSHMKDGDKFPIDNDDDGTDIQLTREHGTSYWDEFE